MLAELWKGKTSAPSTDEPASFRAPADFDFISFHLHEGCLSNYHLMIMLPLSCLLMRTRSSELENSGLCFESFKSLGLLLNLKYYENDNNTFNYQWVGPKEVDKIDT